MSTKPFGWRIERFSKTSGKREFDQTEYDAEPSPDFLANMGRSWRVVVTELHAGISDVDQECLRVGQQINRAIVELPEHRDIEINIQHGATTVYFTDFDLNNQPVSNADASLSLNIERAINDTIKAARGAA